MSSSRRSFLAATGLASAGLLWRPATRGPAPPSPSPPQLGARERGHRRSPARAEPTAARRGPRAAAVDAAQKAGASYADVRLVQWQREQLSVRDDHVSNVGLREEYGLGVRVLADGAWGFAATSRRLDASRRR
jgi:TldD protein